MKKTKKFSKKFSLLTIFILLISIISMDVYAAKLPFTDVPEKAWYYDDVKSAYESDLISGKKPTKYAPNDNMTAAEAVKLAAAMHMLKNQGAVKFTPSKPWYKVYVDYAKRKGLISGDLTWNKNITRAGYMQIFANILTDEEAKKNEVADGSIPDVPMTHPNAQAIYKLYRAGIVTGVDEKKNCSPASNIKRSEVAAILIRMMNPKRRLGFNLSGGTIPPGTTPPPGGTTPPPSTSPLKITKQPQSIVGKFLTMVTLEVAVEGGKAPYSYQWEERHLGAPNFKNSSSTGSTTKALSVGVNDLAYDYRCVITDAKGDKVTSNEARVEVDTKTIPLRVVKHPRNIYGKEGDTVTLEVEVDGGKKPYSYQWKKRKVGTSNYVISDDEGNRTTILKPVIESVACAYACVITDAKGNTVNSSPALVAVDVGSYPLKITKQPEDASSDLAYKVTLEVAVEGGRKPYSYKWQVLNPMDLTFRDTNVEGNNTNVLRPSVQILESFYRCVITDANGKSVTSREAKVGKEIIPLKITKQPVNAIGKYNELVTLEVKADGGLPPYRYQWQFREYGSDDYDDFKNSTSEGNTTNVLRPPALPVVYEYHCIVTDSAGNTVTSDEARVEMPPSPDPLRIIQQPQDAYGKVGERVTLTVKVGGGKKPYRYYWYGKKMVDREFKHYFDFDGDYDDPELTFKIDEDVWEYYCEVFDADHYMIESRHAYVVNTK